MMIGTPVIDPRELAKKPQKKKAPTLKKKVKTGEEVVKNHLEPPPPPPSPVTTEPPSQPQTLDELFSQLPDLGELPAYEDELVEEGWAPGEHPQGIPPSPHVAAATAPPLSPPRKTVTTCPIHNDPVHSNISKRGWAYMQCLQPQCPMWFAKEDAISVTFEWRMQACDDVKKGPFSCFCEKPYKVAICHGNKGRLYLTCKQTPKCVFFQWADTPKHGMVIREPSSPPPSKRARREPPPKRARREPGYGNRDSVLTMWNRIKNQHTCDCSH